MESDGTQLFLFWRLSVNIVRTTPSTVSAEYLFAFKGMCLLINTRLFFCRVDTCNSAASHACRRLVLTDTDTFLKWLSHILVPKVVYKMSVSPYPHQCRIFLFFVLAVLKDYLVLSNCGFNMYFFDDSVAHLLHVYWQFAYSFLLMFHFFFFFCEFLVSNYMLDANPFSDTCVANIFSHSVSCLFINVIFW